MLLILLKVDEFVFVLRGSFRGAGGGPYKYWTRASGGGKRS